MREIRAVVLAVVMLSLPFRLFASEDKQPLADAERVFVEKYVKAINQKDISQLEELMHPISRKCLNPSNEDYYQDLFQRSFKHSIPEDYAAKIEPLGDSDQSFIKNEVQIGQKVGLNYPVDRTHRLDISFELSPSSSVGIIRFLALAGDNFYEVYACPTPEWVEEYRKRKTDKEGDLKYFQKLKEIQKELYVN